MKKLWILLMAGALIAASGCMAPDAYETMNDMYLQGSVPAGKLTMLLPVEAAALTMEGETGAVYVCDGYTVTLHTCEAGDLEATLRTVTGYDRENLSLMERMDEGMKRYECVFTAAGEGGDQTGRGVILDDGNYHYCLSVLRFADLPEKTQINWEDVFSSFCLA
jgi:hypothetical protein